MSDLPLCLDLFCGTGSATDPIREHGCMRVVGIDLSKKAKGRDLTADVRRLPLKAGVQPYFVWASPPCTEFSPLTWGAYHRGQRGKPDPEGPMGMGLVRAVRNVIETYGCRYAVENVGGSIDFISDLFGRPKMGWAGRWIWSSEHFPDLMADPTRYRKPLGFDDTRNERGKKCSYAEGSRIRAMIPRPLAEAIHRAVCPADARSE